MGKLTLYGLDPSPPVRAVLLTLKELNLPHEYIRVDFAKKEHMTDEFLKKNPQHTVPTLDDDEHTIWDSHAIMAYLVRRYAKDDSLYPKDFLKRAKVDQRLHFESGAVFQNAMANITGPLFFRNRTKIPQSKIDCITNIYNFMEAFLGDNDYIADDHLTIADFSLIPTITTLEAFIEVNPDKNPKLFAWIQRMKKLPYYDEVNSKGAKQLFDAIKSKNPIVVSDE